MTLAFHVDPIAVRQFRDDPNVPTVPADEDVDTPEIGHHRRAALNGVHAAHCCQRHGCKYGALALGPCPVKTGAVEQLDPCEQCEHDIDGDGRAEAELFNAAFNLGYRRGHDAVLHALDHVLADIEYARESSAEARAATRTPTGWIGPVLHAN